MQDSDSGRPEEIDLDSSFESDDSDIEVVPLENTFSVILTIFFYRIFRLSQAHPHKRKEKKIQMVEEKV